LASDTSFCWTGAGAKSLFGLRPGLGFAGITHSFEAVAHKVEEEDMTGDGG
jgi:hypothetical protein